MDPSAPFVASPATLLFRDFVPGGSYSATLTLTNRGAEKNSFRLGELNARQQKVRAAAGGGRVAGVPGCRGTRLLASSAPAQPPRPPAHPARC